MRTCTAFVDPFEALFSLQRALEAHLASDWLQDQTTSQGPFPPINVFQQGSDLLAIIELPGVEKSSLQIEAKDNTIRIAGKKAISYPDGVSVHRRERVAGDLTARFLFPSVETARHQGGIPRRHPGAVPAAVRARQAANHHRQLISATENGKQHWE